MDSHAGFVVINPIADGILAAVLHGVAGTIDKESFGGFEFPMIWANGCVTFKILQFAIEGPLVRLNLHKGDDGDVWIVIPTWSVVMICTSDLAKYTGFLGTTGPKV